MSDKRARPLDVARVQVYNMETFADASTTLAEVEPATVNEAILARNAVDYIDLNGVRVRRDLIRGENVIVDKRGRVEDARKNLKKV